MKITVELTELEKKELRERQNEIDAILDKIQGSDLMSDCKAENYEIPELKAARDNLYRAKNKLMYLTALDVVDNDA
jgi:DNA-binding PadR family transcriptional regulator